MNRLQKLFAFKSCRDLTIGEIFSQPEKSPFVHLPQARGSEDHGPAPSGDPTGWNGDDGPNSIDQALYA